MAKKDLSAAKGLDALFQSPAVQPKQQPPAVIERQKVRQTQSKPKKQTTEKRVATAQKRKNTFSVDLADVRKSKAEYTGIRLRRELFQRLQKIADKEKVKSTNSLISKVLEAYCNGYEGS